MAVTVKDLIGLLEQTAPPELKEEWDNPGLSVGDPDQPLSRVIVGMDLTEELIEEARAQQAQLILTHHPLLFHRPASITPATALGRKIQMLIRNGICAYSAHTNLDKVQGGMNDRLMERLGFSAWKVLEGTETEGIGRIASTPGITLQMMAERTKGALGVDCIRCSGDPQAILHAVAVINGAGADFIALARQAGADCVITGDTKYHEVLDALEEGIGVIDPGHFASEWLVFQETMEQLREQVRERFGEVDFIYPAAVKDPYYLL